MRCLRRNQCTRQCYGLARRVHVLHRRVSEDRGALSLPCAGCLQARLRIFFEETRKKPDQTSRQTNAGIGRAAPTHRCGHVQNRIRRRQARRGKRRTDPYGEM